MGEVLVQRNDWRIWRSDRLDSQYATPILVREAVLERTFRVLLGDEGSIASGSGGSMSARGASHGTVFGYPWRSKRFKVSTPMFHLRFDVPPAL